jgi:uncharacterized membrane protein YuzA (DUF378 family)
MESFGIILMILGAVSFLSGLALLFGVASLYAIMTYLEKKE